MTSIDIANRREQSQKGNDLMLQMPTTTEVPLEGPEPRTKTAWAIQEPEHMFQRKCCKLWESGGQDHQHSRCIKLMWACYGFLCSFWGACIDKSRIGMALFVGCVPDFCRTSVYIWNALHTWMQGWWIYIHVHIYIAAQAMQIICGRGVPNRKSQQEALQANNINKLARQSSDSSLDVQQQSENWKFNWINYIV